MTPDKIADAALLAAQAPASGVLPPRDDRVEAAVLDLWADKPAVARSKLVQVARAFGPRLQLQEGFRLLINSGELAPPEAAAVFSEAAFGENGGPLIAAIRGEEVLDQLEAFIAAGCELCDHEGCWSLAKEERTIAKAWAAAPEAVVQTAEEEGATIVITRQASEETLRDAAPASDAKRLISVEMVEGYRLRATTPHNAMLSNLAPDLEDLILRHENESDGSVQLQATATRYDEIAAIALRLELTAGTGAFDRPLLDQIQAQTAHAWIEAPVDLVEFGADIRTAAEWIN